ncbi:TPA: SLATT domain-containing protein [Vibrio diabolicus]
MPSEIIGRTEPSKKALRLEKMLENSISYTVKEMKRYKFRAALLRIAVLTFSTLATILLGLKNTSSYSEIMSNIAFVLTALVTALSAIDSYFGWKKLWIAHESAIASFNAVLDSLRFYSTSKNDSDFNLDDIESYYVQYEGIWSALNKKWQYTREQSLKIQKH